MGIALPKKLSWYHFHSKSWVAFSCLMLLICLTGVRNQVNSEVIGDEENPVEESLFDVDFPIDFNDTQEVTEPSHWGDDMGDMDEDYDESAGNSTRGSNLSTRGRKLAAACDYSNGYWVRDVKRKPYTYRCKYIRSAFNCRANGRKNVAYEQWSWKTRTCKQQRFDVNYFLKLLQGKIVGIIGDSFGINFSNSLVCQIASKYTVQTYTAVIRGRTVTGYQVPRFGVKIIYINSPYIVQYSNKKADFQKYGVKWNSIYNYLVWLDAMDWRWKDAFKSVDLTIFMSGHWYQISEGKTVVRSTTFIRSGKVVKLTGPQAYKIALGNVKKYVNSPKIYRGVPSWLTFSPSHYTVGSYFGKRMALCTAEWPLSYVDMVKKYKADTSLVWKNLEMMVLKNTRFRMIETTFMSNGRPDAHVQRYFGAKSNSKTPFDCTHWCLPGVPDVWTDILQHVLKTQLKKQT